jgi:rhodanese-related sulfurtransferase
LLQVIVFTRAIINPQKRLAAQYYLLLICFLFFQETTMTLTPMDLVAQAKQQITEINIDEAKNELGTSLILDVREPAEYAAGHLPGAVNIPRGVLEFKIGAHPDFQDKQGEKIIVYCQTGGRSALAAEALNKIGYGNAVSMAGGFKAWTDRGNKVSA